MMRSLLRPTQTSTAVQGACSSEITPACLSTLLPKPAAVQGACSNESCPYLHVNFGPGTPTCPAFLRGYCPQGAACSKKHVTSSMVREIRAARSPHAAPGTRVSCLSWFPFCSQHAYACIFPWAWLLLVSLALPCMSACLGAYCGFALSLHCSPPPALAGVVGEHKLRAWCPLLPRLLGADVPCVLACTCSHRACASVWICSTAVTSRAS